MSLETSWSTDPEENRVLDELTQVARAMAELLHSVDNARYTDPSGGFTG
ncbi:hypothetical protein [Nocardia sp. NPDC049149]